MFLIKGYIMVEFFFLKLQLSLQLGFYTKINFFVVNVYIYISQLQ